MSEGRKPHLQASNIEYRVGISYRFIVIVVFMMLVMLMLMLMTIPDIKRPRTSISARIRIAITRKLGIALSVQI